MCIYIYIYIHISLYVLDCSILYYEGALRGGEVRHGVTSGVFARASCGKPASAVRCDMVYVCIGMYAYISLSLYIYIYIYICMYVCNLGRFARHIFQNHAGAAEPAARPISPLTLSLLTLLESNFPGKSLGNPYGPWNSTPLKLRLCSSRTLRNPQC